MKAKSIFGGSALSLLLALLSGCSYLFRSGVSGTYPETGKPLLGYVQSTNEDLGGRLLLGSAEKEECQGIYEVAQDGTSIMGLVLRKQIYRGAIYCLDGRTGEFELVSETKGRSGTLTGTVGGQAFQAVMIEPLGKRCGDDDCRWGIKWTYESEIEQQKIYSKVEAESK
jgi:hypothetical protein